MNKQRRKTIEEVIGLLEDAKSTLETITEEEQEAYDNLPEGIQDSERGETMYNNVSEMEEASSTLEDVISQLQDVIEA